MFICICMHAPWAATHTLNSKKVVCVISSDNLTYMRDASFSLIIWGEGQRVLAMAPPFLVRVCYITWGRPMNIYAGTYLWYVWGAEFRIVSMGPRTESNAPPTSKPYIFRYFHIDIIISPYISSPSLVISSFQVIYSSSSSFNPSISWM